MGNAVLSGNNLILKDGHMLLDDEGTDCCCGCPLPEVGDGVNLAGYFEHISKTVTTYNPYSEDGCDDADPFPPPDEPSQPSCAFNCDWVAPTGEPGIDQTIEWRERWRIPDNSELLCTAVGSITVEGTPVNGFQYEGVLPIYRSSEGLEELIEGPSAMDPPYCGDIMQSQSYRDCITLGETPHTYWGRLSFVFEMPAMVTGQWYLEIFRYSGGMPDYTSRYCTFTFHHPDDPPTVGQPLFCEAMQAVLQCAVEDGTPYSPDSIGDGEWEPGSTPDIYEFFFPGGIVGGTEAYYAMYFVDPAADNQLCCVESSSSPAVGYYGKVTEAKQGYFSIERTD